MYDSHSKLLVWNEFLVCPKHNFHAFSLWCQGSWMVLKTVQCRSDGTRSWVVLETVQCRSGGTHS